MTFRENSLRDSDVVQAMQPAKLFSAMEIARRVATAKNWGWYRRRRAPKKVLPVLNRLEKQQVIERVLRPRDPVVWRRDYMLTEAGERLHRGLSRN